MRNFWLENFIDNKSNIKNKSTLKKKLLIWNFEPQLCGTAFFKSNCSTFKRLLDDASIKAEILFITNSFRNFFILIYALRKYLKIEKIKLLKKHYY